MDQFALGGFDEAEQSGILVIDAEVIPVVVEVADQHPTTFGVAADLRGQRDFIGSAANCESAVKLAVLMFVEHEGRGGILLYIEEIVALKVPGELFAVLALKVGYVDLRHIDHGFKRRHLTRVGDVRFDGLQGECALVCSRGHGAGPADLMVGELIVFCLEATEAKSNGSYQEGTLDQGTESGAVILIFVISEMNEG